MTEYAHQLPLPGFDERKSALIALAQSRPLDEKMEQALETFRMYENAALKLSDGGYWLAFSGGKDSIVLKDLAIRSRVRFRSVYNVTSIDPPELIRYMKRQHPDVEWNRPRVPMFVRMLEKSNGPPTRLARWCCRSYKERGGRGMGRAIGVRAAESPRRADNWSVFTADRKSDGFYLAPILYWTDDDVWSYIRANALPYCSLYDEGFKRLGCVGCPMQGSKGVKRDFERWPGYGKQWHRAIVKFWEKWHDVPTLRGKPRWFADFKDGQELYDWWISGERREPFDDLEDCQMSLMWSSGNETEV